MKESISSSLKGKQNIGLHLEFRFSKRIWACDLGYRSSSSEGAVSLKIVSIQFYKVSKKLVPRPPGTKFWLQPTESCVAGSFLLSQEYVVRTSGDCWKSLEATHRDIGVCLLHAIGKPHSDYPKTED